MSIEESTYEGMARRIEELESQLEQAVDCINKIHNLYQEDKVFTVYLGEGFYTDEYSDLMFKLICNDDAAIASIQDSEVKLSAVPAQEPVSENLKNAVALVLEGWTLPDGVRKILETAYFQEPVKPVKQESWMPIETAPKGKKIIVSYKNAYGNDRTVFAKYIEKFTAESTCDTECETDYSEDDDTFYLKEGWVELIDNWDEFSSVYFDSRNVVTGWMPAPPVKEVTE